MLAKAAERDEEIMKDMDILKNLKKEFGMEKDILVAEVILKFWLE